MSDKTEPVFDHDNPEWTEADFARAKAASELLPELAVLLKTTPFDASKYFDTPEAQAELLNDARQSGHPGYLAKALDTAARARRIAGEEAS